MLALFSSAMFRRSLALFLSLNILFVPVTLLAEEELSLDDPDVKACIDAQFGQDGRTQVTPELLRRGTFRLLIRDCVEERGEERQKNNRHWRIQQRTKVVLDRLKRNSRSGITHFGDVVADPQKAIEQRSQRVQESYRMRRSVEQKAVVIPVRQPILRATGTSRIRAVQQPTEHPKTGWRTYQGERPSRRQFDRQKSLSNEEDRVQRSSILFQERQKEALRACSHLTNNFERENCIRQKIRELGAE